MMESDLSYMVRVSALILILLVMVAAGLSVYLVDQIERQGRWCIAGGGDWEQTLISGACTNVGSEEGEQ